MKTTISRNFTRVKTPVKCGKEA